MAITTSAICNSFKKELLEGKHNFTQTSGDVFKLSLYTSSATLGKSTTSFTTDNEVSASGQYASGGGKLAVGSQQTSVASDTAIVDFGDRSFTGVTLTARGALIYNTSNSNTAVACLDFGGDKSATSGTFTIQFPAFTTSAAIVRIA
jgi:hypothetical protein|tara:strand:+ start:3282 stop:3722 length:441 start_codon:yes stop_codon:yes gene_type:complete